MDSKNREKSILVITELFLPTKGGTAVWFDAVYRRLGRKNIHILTEQVEGSDDIDQNHPNTVHRVRLARYRWLRPESLNMYLKLFCGGLFIALRKKCRSVHAGRVLPEGLVGLLISRLLKIPLVIYAHGEEITTWRQKAKYKAMCFTYCHADAVIANSGFTESELLALNVSKQRIFKIHPGVDISRFKPGLDAADLCERIDKLPEQKLLFSVGRLSRRKGFDTVIRIIPRLMASGLDVQYIVAGIGDDLPYLKNLAKELGVLDRVHLLGHVTNEDLPRWYNAADVFIMPNREINGDTEGFGMVFLEAAACRKPSIAGTAGGTGNAVTHEFSGLRVDGKSEKDVTRAAVRVLTDEHLATEMGSNGMNRVHAEFSWETVAKNTKRFMA